MKTYSAMFRWCSFVGLFMALVSAVSAQEFSEVEGSGGDSNSIRVQVEHQQSESLRVEVFDSAGISIYDSGILSGWWHDLPVDEINSQLHPEEELTLEVRSWDAEGDLLVSQLTRTKHLGGDEISRVDFEQIPTDTSFVGGAIRMDGDVDVTGSLDVSNVLRTSGLESSSGSSFFGSCAVGSSIRSIDSNGNVTCEPDDTGGGGGDNLGNHIASEDLEMGNHTVQFNNQHGLRASGGAEVKSGPNGHTFQFHSGVNSADLAHFNGPSGNIQLIVRPSGDVEFLNARGIRAAGGAEFKTGPNGGTFQFHAGNGTANIAHFNDVSGNLRLAVPPTGGLDFHGGQKGCSAYDSTGRNSTMASASWTSADCSSFRDAVAPTGNYQLFCIFDDGFSFGGANGIPPSRNCGW